MQERGSLGQNGGSFTLGAAPHAAELALKSTKAEGDTGIPGRTAAAVPCWACVHSRWRNCRRRPPGCIRPSSSHRWNCYAACFFYVTKKSFVAFLMTTHSKIYKRNNSGISEPHHTTLISISNNSLRKATVLEDRYL